MRSLRNLTDELREARQMRDGLRRMARVNPDDAEIQRDAAMATHLVADLQGAVAKMRTLALHGWTKATSADIGRAARALDEAGRDEG